MNAWPPPKRGTQRPWCQCPTCLYGKGLLSATDLIEFFINTSEEQSMEITYLKDELAAIGEIVIRAADVMEGSS